VNPAGEQISSLPEKIPFWKFSASANDFIVLDNREERYSAPAGWLAQRATARRYSAGADGLILIENSKKADIRIRFFNPDGNEFNTCGNGGRCAARFCSLILRMGAKFTMETNIGVVDAIIENTSVKLKFVPPSEIRLNVSLQLDNQEIRGHVVRVGDPHFITHTKNIREIPFVQLARTIRHHPDLAPDGANVHFIEPVSRTLLKIRSFERGVEDETLACGSGCISAATSTYLNHETDPPVRFEPQSGIPVEVHFDPAGKFQDLYLLGDARFIYSGELTKEALSGFPLAQKPE
jgi:diaminopimelate epimerase